MVRKITLLNICTLATLTLLPTPATTQENNGAARLLELANEVNVSGVNANVYNERGLQREQAGNLEQALEYYTIAANMAPGTAAFAFNRGAILQRLDRHAEAAEAFRRVVELEPIDFEAHMALGNSLGALGDYAGAVAEYDIAERLRPSFTRIYYQRGIFRNLAGDHAGAKRDFDIAVRREPQYANAFYNRGVNSKDMERWRRAIRDLDQAISLEPNHGPAHLARGVCHANLGRDQQAKDDLRRAAALGVTEANEILQKFFGENVKK